MHLLRQHEVDVGGGNGRRSRASLSGSMQFAFESNLGAFAGGAPLLTTVPANDIAEGY